MTAVTGLAGPADTRVMHVVHTALRRDLTRTTETLTTDPPPFPAQRIALAAHLDWMMHFLHQHHRSEDEHLYPLVRGRNAEAHSLLDRMHADHRSVDPAMDSLRTAARAYRDSDDARGELIAAIDRWSAVLLPHLDREETEMMPIVSATITEAEWRHWNTEYNVKPLGPIEVFDEGLFIIDDAPARDHGVDSRGSTLGDAARDERPLSPLRVPALAHRPVLAPAFIIGRPTRGAHPRRAGGGVAGTGRGHPHR
ncbi:hemerythrin domain-containing protein [Nocardia seriolae]|uniref:Hemerythrin-like domain-containing protein n=1 Tax=Nocardia seriolae TaxID=37332 RepID=A0A0B8NJV3_9NOCA|nr:hemerythrin domain-containing protein [Nocardia seriolae]APA98688.1 hypothetical protein NS506_04640 [Nocardia seriolae]MTJ63764.1 hemerythrin domain-containing protein [Nocardia seriolae]MTJ74009.1 hemerythrin domain-containing protein [Nocardia seriolae]MTJ88328.1 hemerythrin domain-containing protein [Nocardia seriolae]MTK32313.1 hemerythrin domain-containing protein [Nocardia seriolae]